MRVLGWLISTLPVAVPLATLVGLIAHDRGFSKGFTQRGIRDARDRQ